MINVGDRVRATRVNDHNKEGVVLEISGKRARVKWAHNRTWMQLAVLKKIDDTAKVSTDSFGTATGPS